MSRGLNLEIGQYTSSALDFPASILETPTSDGIHRLRELINDKTSSH